MIDKISGVFVLVCDVCGEAAEEVFSTFDEAVDYKVDEGWKSQRRRRGGNTQSQGEKIGVKTPGENRIHQHFSVH